MMRLIVLVLLAASSVALAQPATTRPVTGPTTNAARSSEAQGEVAKLQSFFNAKDADGLKTFVLLGGDPDAQEKMSEMADAVRQGAFTDARVVPLAEKSDGPVVAVAAGFLKKPGDRRPDIDPVYLVRRDGRLRVILGGSGHLAIMSDEEKSGAQRLETWYSDWIAANRVEVRKRLGDVK